LSLLDQTEKLHDISVKRISTILLYTKWRKAITDEGSEIRY